MKAPLVRDWPALLRRKTAALYLDITPGTFDAMRPRLPQPIVIHGRTKGWLRRDIDNWLRKQRGGADNEIADDDDNDNVADDDGWGDA